MAYRIKIISFGFKYRRPPANMWIDVSFLKNPAREAEWGFSAKISDDMIRWLRKQEGFEETLQKITDLLLVLHKYDDVVCAVGCSSGKHRSPIFAECLKNSLNKLQIGLNFEDNIIELEHLDL